MRQVAIRAVNGLLSRAVRGRLAPLSNLYPWQRQDKSVWTSRATTDVVEDQDSRLADLRARYRNVDARVTTPAVWDEAIVSDADRRNFRGDTQYVYQRANMNLNEIACALSYWWLKAGRARDLLETLKEDGAFGALTIELDGRLVSRDLLDSVGEIDFLRRHTPLGRQSMSLIDIGAGYGRLAHRLDEAVGSTTRILATDAFAASTMLSERYLAFRKSDARVVPLDEVEAELAATPIDIATNIHSFSECTVEAIEWWVERLAAANVRYLMVVPNRSSADGQRCLTNENQDMSAIFERFGYHLVVREPRHDDPFVQRFGMDPCTFFLFARTEQAG